MQIIISKPFLYHVLLVTCADDKIIEAEAQIEKLQAMDSVTLTLSLSGDLIASLEGTFVKEGKTNTIKIEFLNTNSFEVSVPNESEYTARQ